MRLIFLSLCGLATLFGPAQSLSAQVVTNDFFVNATKLIGPSGLVNGRLSGNSLREDGEPTPFGLPARGSVWWSWIAPFSGEGQIQVTNSPGALRLTGCLQGGYPDQSDTFGLEHQCDQRDPVLYRRRIGLPHCCGFGDRVVHGDIPAQLCRYAPAADHQGLSVRERKCLKLRVEKFC